MTTLGGGPTPRLESMFGRYRLASVLGRGGMGVVFLATDTDLDRPVALKFLAPDLAGDPAFRARFVRESRLAAAIEHPGIVPIYEAGERDGALFIAMRYVPGQDLGEQLRAGGPLDAGRTLAIGRQLADALDAAHRRGLIHRDVKPGNVLVEADGGRVQLADFGLTRRAGETAVSVSGVLGTLDYMAPEQISGGTVDGRADQYSLACLLFHCLSGRPPFEADNEAALLYAHVHSPPPRLSERRPGLGTRFDAAFGRALAKDPGARFPDCRSFVAALEGGPPARARPGVATAGVGVVLLVGAISMAIVLATLVVPPGDADPSDSDLAIGPSGRAGHSPVAGLTGPPAAPLRREVIVFSSDDDGDYDLYRADPDGTDQRPLTVNRRNDRAFSVSPDGTTIVVAAGPPGDRDLWLLDAHDGGNARPLTTGPEDDWDPAWSPDGRSIAFTTDRSGNVDIYVMQSDEEGPSEELLVNVTNMPGDDEFAAWSPDGRRLAFSTNHWGGGRDIAVLRLRAPDRPEQWTTGPDYDETPEWSPDGTRIVFSRGPDDLPDPDAVDRDLWTVTDSDHREVRVLGGPARDSDPSFSPDGTQLVFRRGPHEDTELWILDPRAGRERPFTRSMANAFDPAWVTIVEP